MIASSTLFQHPNGLFTWHRYSEEVKVELWSTAVISEGHMVLMDPAPLSEEELGILTKAAAPVAIILTNGNHERASFELKQRLHVPVGASAYAVPELSQKPDFILDGDTTVHDLRPVPIPGAAPGETALLHEASKSLIVGDAILHFDEPGLILLPEKYCSDQATMKKALPALLDLPFEALFFAHGGPILTGAKASLQSLLHS